MNLGNDNNSYTSTDVFGKISGRKQWVSSGITLKKDLLTSMSHLTRYLTKPISQVGLFQEP